MSHPTDRRLNHARPFVGTSQALFLLSMAKVVNMAMVERCGPLSAQRGQQHG